MTQRIIFTSILVTLLSAATSHAELMWRTAPVTAYEKLHRLHAEHSDVAMGPDGSLYMTNGNVNKLVGDRWIDIDPFAEGLMYDKKKIFFTL